MTQQITDFQTFFEDAKAALLEESTLKAEEERLRIEEERIATNIESEKKALADKVSLTIKERLKDVTKSYDDEISMLTYSIKKSKSKREKAKNAGVKERITEETANLHTTNRDLLSQIKTILKKDGVPIFCNTNTFFALYFTHRLGEVCTLLMFFLICFVAIPLGIYSILPEKTTIYLVFIYVAVVFLFGGLYVVIGNLTKAKHRNALLEIRKLRDEIFSNKKRIRIMTKDIKNDNDDGKYHLDSFDAEIDKAENEMAQVTAKKQDAINTFEIVTKNIITEEINESVRPRLEKLENEYKHAKSSLDNIAVRRKEVRLSISDKYEIYLGKEFLTIDKIESLEQIILSGKASSISEALEVYKSMQLTGV